MTFIQTPLKPLLLFVYVLSGVRLPVRVFMDFSYVLGLGQFVTQFVPLPMPYLKTAPCYP